MNTKEILRRCGYEHGKDQVVLERLNLKSKNESSPKSFGRFVMHKHHYVPQCERLRKPVERNSPNIDLLESPDYIQYSSLGIHKN